MSIVCHPQDVLQHCKQRVVQSAIGCLRNQYPPSAYQEPNTHAMPWEILAGDLSIEFQLAKFDAFPTYIHSQLNQ